MKAVVADPASVRRRLQDAQARPGFRGMLEDRRYDRSGELSARGEVLRTRTYRAPGELRHLVTWKGPTEPAVGGYKIREELEIGMEAPADPLLRALGFHAVQAIDRFVELYRLADVVVRLEWYPRMDVLVEVEGSPSGIEAGVLATGIPRSDYLPDALADFVVRYEARTGRTAALALAELAGEPPSWEAS